MISVIPAFEFSSPLRGRRCPKSLPRRKEGTDEGGGVKKDGSLFLFTPHPPCKTNTAASPTKGRGVKNNTFLTKFVDRNSHYSGEEKVGIKIGIYVIRE